MARINGTAGDDEIFGNAANNQIFGFAGNDQLYGEQGNDHLVGGGGNDSVYGAVGRDWTEGGNGNDSVVDFTGDYNILDGGAGNDQVWGVGDLYGRAGDDNLYTGHGGELQGTKLTGGGGHDTFSVYMDADAGSTHDANGVLTGLGAPQKIIVADFHPGEDTLWLGAADPLGNQFIESPMLTLFDSNGDNVLNKDDQYVDATADQKGIEMHFWNVTLEFDNIQDFLL